MKTAFDESDCSPTPRKPDLSNPDQSRFAVPAAMDIGDSISSDVYGSQPFTTKTPPYTERAKIIMGKLLVRPVMAQPMPFGLIVIPMPMSQPCNCRALVGRLPNVRYVTPLMHLPNLMILMKA